ncbi:hypothetical protein PF011_g13419 [Phytophthora fragariae]|nr:hypothetical protein PF011_g13419 [Phytophthora fragariae]
MIGWSYRKKDLVFAIYNVFKLPINLEGVDGPNFDIVLLCREIVETALQTQQAYRMSLLLPRRGLNRGYVALLVLNCWSTALCRLWGLRQCSWGFIFPISTSIRTGFHF